MALSRRDFFRLSAAGAAGTAILNGLPAWARETDSAPQPTALIWNLPGRQRQSLDGDWSYILDPFDVAGRKPRARRNFWENTIETAETGLIEYEWASSQRMSVPGDWNSADQKLWYYDNPVYFRRVFRQPPRSGRRYFLRFEAVNRAATVWLDGVQIGHHEGGFTPFEIEITDAVTVAAGGEFSLVVRADSRHTETSIPGLDFDWMNWGGITRSVALLDLPEVFVRDAFIRLEGGLIRADVRLDGGAGEAVEVDIRGLGLRLSGRADASGLARLSAQVPEGLRRWSPGDPHLYTVTVRGGGDETTDRIGFRTLEVRGREVLVNGAPVYFCGISMHEEAFGPEATRAVSQAEARALLAEAKSMGCNFVRLAHYPHADHTARIADEMGIMLWSEIPVYWEEIAYDNANTLAAARTMMAELVTRDRSRASVVMWSVANETPQTAERTQFLRQVIADTRALDPTRLITAALNKNVDVGGVAEGESLIVVQDELAADLDVVAINQYEAWYSKRTPAELVNVSFRNGYDKPLMFSEFGAGALYGHHGPREDRWTEEYQAWLFEETLKRVEATPGCVGLAPWLLKDFRSPRRWHGRFQELWNRKGVVSPEGHRKQAFFVLQDFYRRKDGQD